MSQIRYYSPKIRRDLVTKLYWKAQMLDVPMTTLVDHIVAEALGKYRTRRPRGTERTAEVEQLKFDF